MASKHGNVGPSSLSMRPTIRPPAARPQPGQQTVEAEKIDPSVLGVTPRMVSKEQELLDNAEPIPLPEERPMPLPPVATKEVNAAPTMPEEPKKSMFEEVVPTSLLDRIVKEYGLNRAVVHEALLDGPGLKSPLLVHFRALSWDDYNWGLGMMSNLITQDPQVFSSDAQRTQTYRDLVACRCVLKIDGHWVWDIFKMRQELLALNPAWTTDQQFGIPAHKINEMASQVFSLFREKLHYNLLSALGEAVRDVAPDEEQEEGESEQENPT